MATKPHHDSHPMCPTCHIDLTGRDSLSYFANDVNSLLANDDAYKLHEETTTLLHFLGAVAQASPLAVTQYTENTHSVPDWTDDLRYLAEELTEETKRRLELLYGAALGQEG